MIDQSVFANVFLNLMRQHDNGTSIRPEVADLSFHSVDPGSMRMVIDQLVVKSQPESEDHDWEWWYRHGIMTGLLIGVLAGRIEQSQSVMFAKQAWSQFENL